MNVGAVKVEELNDDWLHPSMVILYLNLSQ